MATTLRSSAIRGSPATLTLPDLAGAAVAAPAIAEAIANYNALVTRLADAEAALEAANANARAANDAFLDASAVAVRRRAEAPGRKAVADAEQRVLDARQYQTIVIRALGDAAADLVAAVRAQRQDALDALDEQLAEARQVEADAVERVRQLRSKRAELQAVRRWMSTFPGSSDQPVQYRPGTAGTLPGLKAPNGEPLGAAAVLDALRADAAR